MKIEEKERLARLGDVGKLACSIRLCAAREHSRLSQTELADAVGVGKNSINNMEKARQFPTREVMKYLFRAHGIDFNFLMHGDFNQFSPEVQDSLLEKLAVAERELDP